MNSKKVSEAETNGGKIFLTGWFRASLAVFATIMITLATFTVNRVNANNESVIINANRISVLETKYDSIKDDLKEIKGLLKRAIP